MSYWSCDNEAPRVYQFVGNTPEQVMRECADFLEGARDRGEYLTQWNIAMGELTEDGREQWYGTLTTSGAGFVAPWSEVYYCPTAGEVEQNPGGGFDVCCDRPDLHRAVDETPESDPLLQEWERELLENSEPADDLRCRCSGCNDPWGPGDF